ncbi:MAG TPA: DUF695 domain-containing protein, partial [Cytophagales bacterium]|nr:DUF695 domain-containing protein [Cytophagales bacterium]
MNPETNDIAAFWEWFVANEARFYDTLKKDKEQTPEVLNEILEHVHKYHPNIYGLMGFYDDDTLEFVFTVDGIVKNIVFVDDLVAAAPMLDRWVFTSLKPQYGSFDFSITYYDFEFDKHKLKFFSSINEYYPDEISISLTHSDYRNPEDYPAILNGALIFLDNCLGELNTACRIDYFDLVPEDTVDQQDLIPIEKLESYLVWREKEFLQRYENSTYTFPKESFAVLEGEQDDKPVVAVVNQAWADWPYKPLFSWLIRVEIKYAGNEEGLPNQDQIQLIQELEDAVIERQNQSQICVVGRVTSDHLSTLFIYSNEYKECSRSVYELLKT